MQDPYVILGVSPNATKEDVNEAYREKRAVLAEERFKPGEVGSEAARKLTELDNAYSIAVARLSEHNAYQSNGELDTVEKLIGEGNVDEAQRRLDDMTERSARWHYLQSMVFYRKGWKPESKKQLELAITIDPSNQKYREALRRLENIMSKAENERSARSDGYGSGYDGRQGYDGNGRQTQTGGCCGGSDVSCCTQLLCADCCCEMMGGDLIACC